MDEGEGLGWVGYWWVCGAVKLVGGVDGGEFKMAVSSKMVSYQLAVVGFRFVGVFIHIQGHFWRLLFFLFCSSFGEIFWILDILQQLYDLFKTAVYLVFLLFLIPVYTTHTLCIITLGSEGYFVGYACAAGVLVPVFCLGVWMIGIGPVGP